VNPWLYILLKYRKELRVEPIPPTPRDEVFIRVNKALDFAERVIWTAIQAAAAATLVAIYSDALDWRHVVSVAGIAALAAALKVIIGQNTGPTDLGAITFGKSVLKD
jgi:anti-sigma-K factor RskA